MYWRGSGGVLCLFEGRGGRRGGVVRAPFPGWGGLVSGGL
jgi:hypothetical protein